MTDSPSRPLAEMVHQVLAARVRVLLGQSSFADLLDTQDRVCPSLTQEAVRCHALSGEGGHTALAVAVMQALELDPGYYAASELDFIVTEGLSSAGLALAEVVRGHEGDSRARWQAEVVPSLDRVAAFVLSVLDGRWSRDGQGTPLSQWMAARPG